MGINKLSQYGIKELKDGLTLDKIKSDYSWVLKAVIKDAVLGEQDGHLLWYKGIWKDGTWRDGNWRDGTWKNGVWKCGNWKDGIWYRGYWEGGNWNGGYWKDGSQWFNDRYIRTSKSPNKHNTLIDDKKE